MAILSEMLTSASTRPMASSISMPCLSIRSANASSIGGLANWKWPLSVSMPPSSMRAASLGIGTPARSMISLTISQQEVLDSSHRNTPAFDHPPVGEWWSTTRAGAKPSGALICSGDDVSTTTTSSKPSPSPSRAVASILPRTILDTRSRPSGANTAQPGKHLAMAYAEPTASMSALPWTSTALVRPEDSTPIALPTSSSLICRPLASARICSVRGRL